MIPEIDSRAWRQDRASRHSRRVFAPSHLAALLPHVGTEFIFETSSVATIRIHAPHTFESYVWLVWFMLATSRCACEYSTSCLEWKVLLHWTKNMSGVLDFFRLSSSSWLAVSHMMKGQWSNLLLSKYLSVMSYILPCRENDTRNRFSITQCKRKLYQRVFIGACLFRGFKRFF
jgi:hypothetical protein